MAQFAVESTGLYSPVDEDNRDGVSGQSIIVLAANPMVDTEANLTRPQYGAFRRALTFVRSKFEDCLGVGIVVDHQGRFDARYLDPSSQFHGRLSRPNANAKKMRLKITDLRSSISEQYIQITREFGLSPDDIHVASPEGVVRRRISSDPRLNNDTDFVADQWSCSISADKDYRDPERIATCQGIAALSIDSLTRYVLEETGVEHASVVKAFWEADKADGEGGVADRNTAQSLRHAGKIALAKLGTNVDRIHSVFVDPNNPSAALRVQEVNHARNASGDIVEEAREVRLPVFNVLRRRR